MRKVTIINGLFVAFVLFGTVRSAQASTLYPFTYGQNIPLNTTVSVEVRLDSEGEVVNAAEVVLVYDPAFMEVTGFDRGASFLTLWTDPPSVVSPGKILMSGGRPDGSLVSGGNIATVTFKTVKTGSTTVAIQPGLSGVYLNDSHATPTQLTGRTLTLNITDPLTLLSQPISPSHPVEGTWYRDRSVLLNWTPYRSAVVSYRISRDPLAVPDGVVEDNTGRTVFPSLEDGLWYISFVERISGQSWSNVLRSEIRIDGSSPQPFEVSIQPNGIGLPIVAFNAVDRESGIKRYDVRIERTRWWTPWETVVEYRTVNGPFELSQPEHVTRVTVTAIDLAGNVQTSFVNGSARRDVNRALIILLSMVVGLSVMLKFVWYRRKRSVQPKIVKKS